jgi:hypothetical protein
MYISPYTSGMPIQCPNTCERVYTTAKARLLYSRTLCKQSYGTKVVCKYVLISHRRTITRSMLKIEHSNFLMVTDPR